ncbi:MAG: hypothetical protein WBQ32_15915 [Ignavibacteriaceae bacterium]
MSGVYAQNKYNTFTVTDTIPINFDNLYSISSVSIIPLSEKIVLRNSVLNRFTDYNISYSTASFTLSDSLPYSIFDTLVITYETVRIGLKKEYRKRSLVVKFDEKRGDTVQVVQTEPGGFTPEAIFGPGIQKSGTLIRGFTVGTTKDFSLNSGLRLQLSGNLTEDIEIVAALTDQNTPIQPEGNTERLEEIDKVFIQIKHPNATGIFGDYNLNNRNGEFGVINRKLQGLMGTVNFEPHSGYVAVAGSRGKFNTNNFNGTDGVQGPYRLSGLSGERDIIVLAGTEKVFIDGIEMVRGENNDYIIEYSNATITFTPRRLITNASRIAVDFEYTDRKYARNFFGTGAQTIVMSEKLKIAFQYLQEGDDQDAPIDFSLSEEDKQIISNAGDDPLKAVKPGVTLAPEDSLGIRRGIYQAVDTLINNELYTYYVYNPGDSLSIFNVFFSYVGEGNGDYIRQALGQFEFVGIKKGGYLPVIFLPLPQLKQLGNLTTSITPFDNVQLDLEYAGSLWDKNRLSDLDEKDNYGYAGNIFLKVLPSNVDIGSISLGKIGFSYKERFINKRFTSTDRFNEVEFDRNYNTTGSSTQQDERFREGRINLIPIQELNINSSAGFLKRGDAFRSDRYNNSIRLSDEQKYNISYNLDYVDTRNLTVKSKWWRHTGDAHYIFWNLIKPGFNYLAENKRDKRAEKDSLLSASLEYYELNPYIQLLEIEGLTLTAKYSRRDDYLPLNGLMEKESVARAQIYDLAYRGIDEVSTSLNLTIRNKNYTDSFKRLGFLDTEQLLIRSQSKFNFWEKILNGDLFYEVSTEKQAKLEKVFVRVEQGTGNYKYSGDLNNNGIADENEFEPTLFDGDFILVTLPTDELFPVINLKTNTRWKIQYADIFDKKTFIATLLEPLSTETSWRIEEITKETDLAKIYLLRLNYFQQEGITIRGTNFFQQDIFINENRQDLSFRFRFTQRFAMSDFNTGVETGFNRERSLRIRFRMVKEISNQTDIVNFTDNVSAPQPSTRNRQILDNNITTDFSYRPISIVEVGFKFKVGRSEDSFPDSPTIIDLNSQIIRLNISFAQTGRLRFEVERTELNASTLENFIPFEMLNGNQLGKNYFWRLNFDYRVASFLQTTISYDGRWQGQGRVIHTARAEARAYF